MKGKPMQSLVRDAVQDLNHRTLNRLENDLARLIYLASTRNYNTGRYEHDGLTFRFSNSVAESALVAAHREVFTSLALSPLEALVGQLEHYIQSECLSREGLIETWDDLEAYRVLVPVHENPLIVEIFRGNVRAALAIAAMSLPARQVAASQPNA